MRNMLKVRTDSPFCENFTDLGITKSCLEGEKCYVGKCKYFKLHIKKRVHIHCVAYVYAAVFLGWKLG
jgi:hypothetical protein